MVVFISGSSGSGKNTVIKGVLEKLKNYKYFNSCTSREKRVDDEIGHYIYLSKEDFKKKIESKEIFEYEIIHNEFYGTLQADVERIIKGANYIKDIGVEGKDSYINRLGTKTKILTIFLYVPKQELRRRLILRGDSPEKIEVRLSRFDYEDSFKDSYDYIIENKQLEKTIEEVISIIKKEE